MRLRRPFREPAHQVGVPVAAVGEVDAHARACVGQPPLLGRADAVEHLVLEAVRGAAGQQGQRPDDLDQPRVVGGQHRVTRPVHQRPQAARVRRVDLAPGGEGDAFRLAVGALAEPDPRPVGGQRAAVRLAAAQGRLHHAAEIAVLRPLLGRDPQRRLDRRELLGVQRHRGTRVPRGRADPADVRTRGPGAEEQPDRGRLYRDLRGPALGQSLRTELADQLDVLVGDGRGLHRVLGVLAQVVQGDEEPRGPQRPGHPHGVVGGLARHVLLDDRARPGRGRDELAQPGTG